MDNYEDEPPFVPFVQKSPTGKKGDYVIAESLCPICQARDLEGTPIRFKVDKYMVTHSNKETARWAQAEYGLKFTENRLNTHIKKHSPYVRETQETAKKLIEKASIKNIEKIEEEYLDAEEVLQDIITIGGNRIRTGEMKVSDKLLLGAISEQGKRRQMGTLEQLFAELDRGRFVEGQLVEPEETKLLEDDQKEDNPVT